MVSASGTSEMANATCLANRSRPEGSAATTAEPTSGTTARVVSQGKSFTSEPHQEHGGDHDRGASEHRQGVGADEAGLQPAKPSGGPADEGGEPVHGTVDAAVVQEDQRPGEVLPRAHQQ